MRAFKTHKSKLTTDSRTYRLLTWDQDPYADEGVRYHKSRGIRKYKTKVITPFKVREYRTWKYNRKTQWKEKRREFLKFPFLFETFYLGLSYNQNTKYLLLHGITF